MRQTAFLCFIFILMEWFKVAVKEVENEVPCFTFTLSTTIVCNLIVTFMLQTWSMVSKMTDEKASAIQQNKKLYQELVRFSYLIMASYIFSLLSFDCDF